MLKPDRQLESEVNDLFENLRPGPWFNSGNDGAGPEGYNRADDTDFQQWADAEFGLFNYEPSQMEMPFVKLRRVEGQEL